MAADEDDKREIYTHERDIKGNGIIRTDSSSELLQRRQQQPREEEERDAAVVVERKNSAGARVGERERKMLVTKITRENATGQQKGNREKGRHTARERETCCNSTGRDAHTRTDTRCGWRDFFAHTSLSSDCDDRQSDPRERMLHHISCILTAFATRDSCCSHSCFCSCCPCDPLNSPRGDKMWRGDPRQRLQQRRRRWSSLGSDLLRADRHSSPLCRRSSAGGEHEVKGRRRKEGGESGRADVHVESHGATDAVAEAGASPLASHSLSLSLSLTHTRSPAAAAPCDLPLEVQLHLATPFTRRTFHPDSVFSVAILSARLHPLQTSSLSPEKRSRDPRVP